MNYFLEAFIPLFVAVSNNCFLYLLDKFLANENKKYNCSGPATFKGQRVGYQSNQKLLHHYQN